MPPVGLSVQTNRLGWLSTSLLGRVCSSSCRMVGSSTLPITSCLKYPQPPGPASIFFSGWCCMYTTSHSAIARDSMIVLLNCRYRCLLHCWDVDSLPCWVVDSLAWRSILSLLICFALFLPLQLSQIQSYLSGLLAN